MTPPMARAAALAFVLALVAAPAERAVAAEEILPPSLERGESLWAKCQACHTLEKGGRHIVGPNLWGMFGARAGTRAGYRYSPAMAGSAVVWTDATLDAFLAATQDFMPGSKMYGGLAIAQDRLDLIHWMKHKLPRE
jgi:cytochrome c